MNYEEIKKMAEEYKDREVAFGLTCNDHIALISAVEMIDKLKAKLVEVDDLEGLAKIMYGEDEQGFTYETDVEENRNIYRKYAQAIQQYIKGE
jgi:hypothetical protein